MWLFAASTDGNYPPPALMRARGTAGRCPPHRIGTPKYLTRPKPGLSRTQFSHHATQFDLFSFLQSCFRSTLEANVPSTPEESPPFAAIRLTHQSLEHVMRSGKKCEDSAGSIVKASKIDPQNSCFYCFKDYLNGAVLETTKRRTLRPKSPGFKTHPFDSQSFL